MGRIIGILSATVISGVVLGAWLEISFLVTLSAMVLLVECHIWETTRGKELLTALKGVALEFVGVLFLSSLWLARGAVALL